MIQINSNIPSEVHVDFDMTGNEHLPTLRLFLECKEFFVGFNGSSSRIDIPPLLNIQFPDKTVHARIEVVLDNYNIKIWEEQIKIIQSKEFIKENSINIIKINVKLKKQKSSEPQLKVKQL